MMRWGRRGAGRGSSRAAHAGDPDQCARTAHTARTARTIGASALRRSERGHRRHLAPLRRGGPLRRAADRPCLQPGKPTIQRRFRQTSDDGLSRVGTVLCGGSRGSRRNRSCGQQHATDRAMGPHRVFHAVVGAAPWGRGAMPMPRWTVPGASLQIGMGRAAFAERAASRYRILSDGRGPDGSGNVMLVNERWPGWRTVFVTLDRGRVSGIAFDAESAAWHRSTGTRGLLSAGIGQQRRLQCPRIAGACIKPAAGRTVRRSNASASR